jgi:hypothetical protein
MMAVGQSRFHHEANVGRGRQQCTGYLLTYRAYFSSASPLVGQPHWLLVEIAIPNHFESSGISGLLCQISGNSGIFPEFLCTQLICFKTAFTALYSDETCYQVYYSKSPNMTLLLNKQ